MYKKYNHKWLHINKRLYIFLHLHDVNIHHFTLTSVLNEWSALPSSCLLWPIIPRLSLRYQSHAWRYISKSILSTNSPVLIKLFRVSHTADLLKLHHQRHVKLYTTWKLPYNLHKSSNKYMWSSGEMLENKRLESKSIDLLRMTLAFKWVMQYVVEHPPWHVSRFLGCFESCVAISAWTYDLRGMFE